LLELLHLFLLMCMSASQISSLTSGAQLVLNLKTDKLRWLLPYSWLDAPFSCSISPLQASWVLEKMASISDMEAHGSSTKDQYTLSERSKIFRVISAMRSLSDINNVFEHRSQNKNKFSKGAIICMSEHWTKSNCTNQIRVNDWHWLSFVAHWSWELVQVYCCVHISEHGSSTRTKLNCTNVYNQNPYY